MMRLPSTTTYSTHDVLTLNNDVLTPIQGSEPHLNLVQRSDETITEDHTVPLWSARRSEKLEDYVTKVCRIAVGCMVADTLLFSGSLNIVT
ncbi:hypothetical protein JTE90_025129 [Oedothorax gibbosus]|uniref:Uncharacterized protein n=1 Tax=Oedothorax gibbosus TaxID=931172 RepID=A0AAV6UHL7_9ARAC|nr:hypothetical protein JTE90_025129 [Oedothorax gibbosus]